MSEPFDVRDEKSLAALEKAQAEFERWPSWLPSSIFASTVAKALPALLARAHD